MQQWGQLKQNLKKVLNARNLDNTGSYLKYLIELNL